MTLIIGTLFLERVIIGKSRHYYESGQKSQVTLYMRDKLNSWPYFLKIENSRTYIFPAKLGKIWLKFATKEIILA